MPAVPCLSRASEIERYDPKSEFALAGDDEGWVATHQDPGAAGAAGGSGNAADDIPDLDEAPAQQQTATAAAASGEDDVPDISELEIVEPDDEVRTTHSVPQHCRTPAGAVSYTHLKPPTNTEGWEWAGGW